MKTLFGIILTSVLFSSAVQAGTVAGTFRNEAGSRRYKLYQPGTSVRTESPGLIVMLHGCFQNPDQFAAGTDMNTYADRSNFLVLYPEQTSADNSWQCWNWFLEENHQRGSGELSILAGMTEEVRNNYGVDPGKIFVAGLSAGGAMASNLAGCYPDIFAAAAVHSGLEFSAATSETEAHQVIRSGPSRPVEETASASYECGQPHSHYQRTLVIHGTRDSSVAPLNAERVIEQAIAVNDRIDDGQANSSAEFQTEDFAIPPSQPRYYATRATDFSLDGQVLLRRLLVVDMGHGWSGGKSSVAYMEPRGINASQELVNFFLGLDRSEPGARRMRPGGR